MSEEISKKLASTKPVKDYILVCTDEKTRKMEYISPKLIKLDDEYFISDLLKDKDKINENILKLVDTIKILTAEHNNFLNAFNAFKLSVQAEITNLKNTIKEMGGNL